MKQSVPSRARFIASPVFPRSGSTTAISRAIGWAYPKVLIRGGEIRAPPNLRLLGPHESAPPNGIWIGSAVFAGVLLVANRQTHRATCVAVGNKSVFSFLRRLTMWHYPHSPAARRAAVGGAAIDIICWPGPQQQTCWNRHTDRWADGRTPDRCIDPARHSTRAVPISRAFGADR